MTMAAAARPKRAKTKSGGTKKARADAASTDDARVKGDAPEGTRATAESMAAKQRDISVSEFFAKNRHLLGFDNPRKALLTTVKEAVDNSLDACEEAGILPEISVIIEDLEPSRPASAKSGKYRVTIVDNGPGIVRKQVEHIFGRLLYGSKFHRLKMSRGQQGIGISAAGMYGLLTTGRPMVIHTKPKGGQPAHHIELAMNTKTNRAEVTVDVETDDFPPARFATLTPGTRTLASRGEFLSEGTHATGTSVSIELEGRYQRGRGSVDEFLELTAIANPHARIVFVPPSKVSASEDDDASLLETRGRGKNTAKESEASGDEAARTPPTIAGGFSAAKTEEYEGAFVFPRGVEELPPETKEIQPHPKGVELGILLQMLKDAEQERDSYTLYNFLQDKFSRVSPSAAGDLCKSIGLSSRARVSDVDHAKAEKLFKVLQDAKLPPPPTDCLAPIGVRQMLAGMLKGVRAEFYAASSRNAEVYRGRPFLIEAAIAYGGSLAKDDSCRVIRFANRVPLLFQQSACSSFKAVAETNWKNYDLQQPRGAVPVGPLVVMIHMASVWVPFTSESKEAIADYDEIRKEMKLALMECGRKLGTYLRKRAKMRREGERRDVFERYIGEIAQAIEAINGTDAKELYDVLLAQAKSKTAVADQVLDDEGRVVRDAGAGFDDDDGVIVVDDSLADSARVTPPSASDDSESKPVAKGTKRRASAGESDEGLFGESPAPKRRTVKKVLKKKASR
ncbi:MAG: DNA topoisomerase VI subunit B [Phycisphaerales bacterium]|jgi:DNA topoisomerase-6 subunit B|nr:DNA topoisomerase VI subunit B [Phycisphaerales bacterium]